MKNDAGRFTSCNVRQPDPINLHLPSAYSAPSGNNGVNWLGNNTHQPNGATGYGGGSLSYPEQVYDASNQSISFFTPQLMVVPSARISMVGGDAYRTHIMDLPGQVKALAQVVDCPSISKGAIHFAQMQNHYKFNDRPIAISDLTYMIHKKAHAGWGHEVFSNIKDLNLYNANSSLTDFALLFQALHHQQLDLNTINLSSNQLDDAVGADLFRWLRNDENISAHAHVVKYIGLYNNNIGNYGADMIATHLSIGNFSNLIVLDLHNNQIGDKGAELIAASLTRGTLPNLKVLDVSGNQITPIGQGHFVCALDSRPTQSIAITLELKKDKNVVWEFVTKGLKYVIEQHYKAQQLSENAILAIYDDGDFGTCKVALKQAAFGISAGVVSKLLNPSTSALIKSIPGWQGKVIVGVGIFISACKDALSAGDIVNPDLLNCIGAVNRHLGVGFMKSDEVKNLGDFYDIDNFLDGN